MAEPKKRKLSHKSTSDEVSTPGSRANLNSLPDLPVLEIASNLNVKDLLNFSHSCKNVHDICEADYRVWAKALQKKPDSIHFRRIAGAIATNGRQVLFSTRNPDKLSVLMYCKTKQNWMTPESSRLSTLILGFPYYCSHMEAIHSTDHVAFFTYEQMQPEWVLKFYIWDVKTGTDTFFNVTGEKRGDPEFPEAHLLNDLVLVFFSEHDKAKSHILEHICYRIKMAERVLKKCGALSSPIQATRFGTEMFLKISS